MIGDALSYLFVNAKVMAKEGKFIAPAKWEDLWACRSPGELASLLEGTDYFPYLSERAISDSRELENAIVREFSEVGREISKIIPKGAWPIREYLLRKWDVVNLRTLIRGIHAGSKREELVDSFIEGGELNFTVFKALADAEGMEDLIARLATTPFRSLKDCMPRYSETKNLFFLEALLDRIFWEGLWAEVLKRERPKEFRNFTGICVEAHNLKILLRAKHDGLALEEIDPFLIPHCSLLDGLLPAFDEEDLSGLITLLEGTIYFEPLLSAQAEHERTSSVLPFEEVLERMVLKTAEDIRKKKPFGPGPLIGFLVAKEKEVRSLLAIVRSTEVDLNRDEIRQSLAGD